MYDVKTKRQQRRSAAAAAAKREREGRADRQPQPQAHLAEGEVRKAVQVAVQRLEADLAKQVVTGGLAHILKR